MSAVASIHDYVYDRLRPSVTVRLRSNTAPQTARKVTQMQADTKRQPANVFMESSTLYFYCRDFADYREGTQAAKRIRPHAFLSEEDLWGGSKGVINFPWIFFFFCNAEFSPCWALSEYIRALIHLACLRVFSVML